MALKARKPVVHNTLPLLLTCAECMGTAEEIGRILIPADALSFEHMTRYLIDNQWGFSAASVSGSGKPEFWVPLCPDCTQAVLAQSKLRPAVADDLNQVLEALEAGTTQASDTVKPTAPPMDPKLLN